MTQPIRVLALCGSLRQKSFNKMALAVAKSVAPPQMTIDVAEIGDLPLYNDDVYNAGCPAPAQRLRDQCAAADAILFVTPEYNHAPSAALKNALDFLFKEWNNKSAGFVGYGGTGAVRSVDMMRMICSNLELADVRAQVSLTFAADFEKFTTFKPLPHQEGALGQVLGQVEAWAKALKPLRQG